MYNDIVAERTGSDNDGASVSTVGKPRSYLFCLSPETSRETKIAIALIFVVFVAMGLLAGVVILSSLYSEALNEGMDMGGGDGGHTMEGMETTPTTTLGYPVPPTGIDRYCVTDQCIVSAERLFRSLDVTSDPCQDFYKYSCGGQKYWNPRPLTKPVWGRSTQQADTLKTKLKGILETSTIPHSPKAIKNARYFYESCLGEYTFETTGMGLPSLDTTLDTTSDFSLSLGNLRRQLGLQLIFGVQVAPDELNATRYSVYIDQPSLGLSREYLVRISDFQVQRDSYQGYIQKTVEKGQSSPNQTTPEETSLRILDFETKLAEITQKYEERANKLNLYSLKTIEELQAITDGAVGDTATDNKINWSIYFSAVFNTSNLEPDLISQGRVVVRSEDFIVNVATLLASVDRTTINEYLWWRQWQLLGPYADTTLEAAEFKHQTILYGVTEQISRRDLCVDKVNQHFGFALSYYYVQDNFKDSMKARVLQLVTELKGAFEDLTKQADDWIRLDDLSEIRSKDKALMTLMGYQDWLMTGGALDKYSPQVEINRTSLLQNLFNLFEWQSIFDLDKINSNVDREWWPIFPTSTEHVYSPNLNTLFFPAAGLQPEVLNQGLEALNYGAAAATIAQAYARAFNNIGLQYDEFGNVVQWWSDEGSEAFQNRSDCFVKQYDGLVADQIVDPNIKVNGAATLGENIADNVALREAWLAFEKYKYTDHQLQPLLFGLEKFSDDQLFFLSYVSEHCEDWTDSALVDLITNGIRSPGQFRVNLALQNFAQFSRTWNCPGNSPMNAPDKCILW